MPLIMALAWPYQNNKAILGDEHSVLTVSAMLRGEYGQMDVFAGVPCIINQNGVQRVLPLSLTPEELEKLGRSCDTLREGYGRYFLIFGKELIEDSVFRIFWEAAAQTAAHDCQRGLRSSGLWWAGDRRQEREEGKSWW